MTGSVPDFNDFTIGSGLGRPCDLRAQTAVDNLLDSFELWWDEHEDTSLRRLVALGKAFGIAADICASAVAERTAGNGNMASFVKEQLTTGLTPADFDQIMIRWAWDNIDHGLDPPQDPNEYPPGFQPHGFQLAIEQAASEGSRLVLAEAGCGSGKSLAAYLWGKRWCDASQALGRAGFHFIFTLPTTGTASEHFKDYALACGLSPTLKGLSHSRSSVDLTFVAQESAPQEESDATTDTRIADPRGQADQARQMLEAQRDKIESLDLWGTPLIVSTTDTVLGLVANSRRSVYSFPVLMQSAIVFDEVHAFDDELFGHLLVFLENFPNLPMLMMTASLPKERLRAIELVRPDLYRVSGPPELEEARRYEPPLVVATESLAWEHIRECLAAPDRGKVLWVRNQVSWANRTYAQCFQELQNPRLFIGIYHSRFRYKDRVRIQRTVIDEFKRKNSPAILITTQVAEMSLNLSADLLVTDLAPIPPLIQRFGRLNR
jgi:CRISPR-associated endonuclease/helicase Cas3